MAWHSGILACHGMICHGKPWYYGMVCHGAAFIYGMVHCTVWYGVRGGNNKKHFFSVVVFVVGCASYKTPPIIYSGHICIACAITSWSKLRIRHEPRMDSIKTVLILVPDTSVCACAFEPKGFPINVQQGGVLVEGGSRCCTFQAKHLSLRGYVRSILAGLLNHCI